MDEWLAAATRFATSPHAFEAAAVLLALAYLILAARERIACWYCALASTVIFTVLFWDAALPMQSGLNIYYLLMAVYGWYAWRYGGRSDDGVRIRRLRPRQHVMLTGTIAALTLASGALLSAHVESAWPFVDAFTTWGGVVTTVMVARKILENWVYWFVIDLVSIPLYIERGLYLTALLFGVYVVIVVGGYFNWLERYRAEHARHPHRAT